MNLIPMPGVVLVEPIVDDAIIQSTGRDYTNAARIIATENGGPYCVGDIVFYDEYAYRRFEWEGKDIFAVDLRGDGVWIIGKNDDKQTESVQTEGVLTSVPTDPATE